MADRDLPHRVVARFEREASEEIQVEDLPKAQQELVKHVGLKVQNVWETVHGYFVTFHGGQGAGRFTKEFLHKLMSSPVFRWVEEGHGGGSINVGM
jgi:hypothetical protein